MGIVDTVRDVAVLVQKADNIELNQKVLELQSQVMELLSENHQLRSQVRELAERAQVMDQLVFDDNLYWLEQGDERDGPFCTKCWDVGNNLVRLHTQGRSLLCPECRRHPEGHWHPSIG